MTVVLVLLHVLLSIQLDSTWQDVRDEYRGAEYQRKSTALNHYIEETGRHPTVLTLGSSRTNMGVRAELLEGEPGPDGRPIRAFNFGLFASGPIATCLYGQQLLEDGIRPEVMTFELFPTALDGPGPGHTTEEDRSWLPTHVRSTDLPQLCRYHSRPGFALWKWSQSRTLLSLGTNSPLRGKVVPRWQKVADPPAHVSWQMDRCGWVRAPLTPMPSEGRAKAFQTTLDALSKKSPGMFQDYRIGEGVRRAIHDLLANYQQRGSRVVLLVPPTESYFRSISKISRSSRGERMEDAFQEFVRELVSTHGCAVIDARAWVPDDGFFDGYHLTYEGAEQFTIRLRGELVPLLPAK
jgi:hypothetical protein